MSHLHAYSNFSPKYQTAVRGRGCFTALQTTERPIYSILNTCQNRKAIHCSHQRVFVINKIRNGQSINNRNYKLLERQCHVPVKLADGCASKSNDEDDYATTSLKDILSKKLHAIYKFVRPYVVLGNIMGVMSLSFLAIANITDLTPRFFVELLKIVVPSTLMCVYVSTINSLCDLEIDEINKPDRPLLSGDLSKGAAIAVNAASFLMSLATGIILKSPPLHIALFTQWLAGTVYSVDLPFLRWKKNPFLAATCMLILGLTNLFFFIHSQKYVLGRPIVITRSLMFATAFITLRSIILALAKDLPDVDGDREHGVRTLSIILGKERVFWLCVQSLLMAYGAAVMFGVSSSLLPISKLVTILGHSMLAYFLWVGARSTDLSSNASIGSFYLLLWKASCFTARQSTARQIHTLPNTSRSCRKAIHGSQTVLLRVSSRIRYSESINKRNSKSFNRYLVPVTLEDGYASKPEDYDYATSFRDIICKKLYAFYLFTRPHTVIGTIIGITSVSLLPVVNIADLTPIFFKGLLKALVPLVLMNIYIVGLNQLFDVELDRVNKPQLPLASGDFSMGTGVAIVIASLTMSLAMGFMFQSPPLFFALIIGGLLGSVYSVELPFLRWKKNPFLAASSILIVRAVVIQLAFFLHTQKYVLGKPMIITKSFIFATAFMCFFSAVIALFKDIPDVDGDRDFGIQSFSVRLGQERVFWLCAQMLLMAYGSAVILGLSLSFPPSKLVTIFGHCALASFLWLRARSVDFSSKASITSIYMFIWKLFYAEYLLIPFVR